MVINALIAGTVSDVLNPRKADKATGGFRNWTFMSVHMWGESPYGKWILVIVDDVRVDCFL